MSAVGQDRSRPRPVSLRAVGLRVVVPAIAAVTAVGLVCMGVTAVSLLLPALSASAETVSTTPDSCTERSLQFTAHPDDDLLFMNPDVQRDIEAGRCVRTVYLTTGDAAREESYWRLREDGIRAAYATMAGVDDTWTESVTTVDGHPLTTETLDAAPGVSVVFMHLPDGNRRGTGNAIHRHQSLRRLWLGEIPRIDAVDGSTSYDADELRATLRTLIDDYGPVTVRAQDWTIPFHTGDNADHTAAALFVRDAAHAADTTGELIGYAGYPSWTEGANVGGRDLGLKADAIIAYSNHDPKFCASPRCLQSLVTAIRTARQYVVATEVFGVTDRPRASAADGGS